jgi:hypothetical protein
MEFVRLRHCSNILVPKLDHITARECAVALLRKAGFKLHQVSQSSTSVYYLHPAREPYLLRVSDHRSKRDLIGLPFTVARLTISPKDQYLTEHHVENLVVSAIGRYFLGDPKPTRYYGKKGTWEA